MKQVLKEDKQRNAGTKIKNDKKYKVERKDLTLTKVRAVLSESTFDNPKLRGLLVFAANYIFFILVNIFLWQSTSLYAIIPLSILSALTIVSMFIIGHDACHGALFKNKTLNYWVGQLSMLPSLHAYSQWHFGHNRIHHGHTVKLAGDFVWEPTTVQKYKKYNLLQKAMHRIYWSALGSGLYYLIEIWFKGMILYTAKQDGAIRDKVIILSVMVTTLSGFYFFGGQTNVGFSHLTALWVLTKMFFIPFLIWNYVIGFTVYVHHINPDINWKKSQSWSPVYGQLFGTVNYHVPKILNVVFHNIMIHMPHHVHMKIPYYHLPRALAEIKEKFSEHVKERNTMFGDYFKATKLCKLYDSEKEEWRTYAQALR